MAEEIAAPESHRRAAPRCVRCAVLTISDTRTLDDDRSGALLVELLAAAGHAAPIREIVPDEPEQVAARVARFAADESIDAVLLTGGTGVAPRDQTPEAVANLFDKQLPGFGELFRMLSFAEIGAAAMLSRATAGIVDGTAVFLMPGSTAAVRLAMEQLVLPELAHVVGLLHS